MMTLRTSSVSCERGVTLVKHEAGELSAKNTQYPSDALVNFSRRDLRMSRVGVSDISVPTPACTREVSILEKYVAQ
jgi:hypothetical protein